MLLEAGIVLLAPASYARASTSEDLEICRGCVALCVGAYSESYALHQQQ